LCGGDTYIHIYFTNPITVLVLEALALFFGEEYVQEKKGWPKKLGQTM
jgi:hypothetical protein